MSRTNSFKILVLFYCLSAENVLSESTKFEKVTPLNASVNQPIVNTTKVPSASTTSSPVAIAASASISTTNSAPTLAPEFHISDSKRNDSSDSSDEMGPKIDWMNIDIDDVKRNETLFENNITKIEEDYHEYYNSTIVNDQNFTNLHRTNIYAECANLTINPLLSQSHRRAMTVKLPFEFPFYGHPISNITIATGGFLYAGDYIHSWLAATQYISPLMANFDTSLSNKSLVKYCEDADSFHVFWEKVLLQNKPTVGPFTFSASLYSSGEIVFGYYYLPMDITNIEDDKHPVKVGVSDAYIIDKTVYHARRKTIFEYHRVNFPGPKITNNTVIRLTPLPTCPSFKNCGECLDNLIGFKCNWCPSLNRCSSGVDRKRQEWTNASCEKTQISEDVKKCSAVITSTTTEKPMTTESSAEGKSAQNASAVIQPDPKTSSAGFVTTICSIFAVLFVISCWVFYAYTHPHTSSGQFLIQYGRPQAWSWRRGEARYTAATIHM